jgi:hypothetical protein
MSFWKWFSIKFHSHEWEVIKEIPVVVHAGSVIHTENPMVVATGTRLTLQCKICGDVKFKDSIK